MLAWLTTTAVCALRRSSAASISIPTVNMNRQTPIWLKSLSAQGRGSKNKLKCSGRQKTENRWTEKNARHHLPYHCRLFKTRKDPANKVRNGGNNEELQKEPS